MAKSVCNECFSVTASGCHYFRQDQLDGLQWKVRYNFKKYVSNEFEFVAFNLSNKILKEGK